VIDVRDSLLLRAARGDADRVAALRLLSDGAELLLERCCDHGRLYVLHDLADAADQPPVGAAILTAGPDPATAVLGSVVTRDDDRALALRVIMGVIEDQRACGRVRMRAAGGDAGRIRLLEQSGFRRCADSARPTRDDDPLWFERDL
jgi:hypothetical protein